MKNSSPAFKREIDRVPELKIHLIGPNVFQNILLRSFLEKNMGTECTYHQKIDTALKYIRPSVDTDIILFDCQNSKAFNPWAFFDLDNSIDLQSVYFIFYNVHLDSDIGKLNSLFEVHGLFYHGESFKIIPKGIKAILDRKLWISRKTVSQCPIENQSDGRIPADLSACLTFRETEILLHLAEGAKNQEIATTLCISRHTVRTHIYNLFKKINVKNRLQATFWAAKYM